MSDAVYWARPDGRLAYVNAAAGQMLGYTAAELMTLSVQDLVPGYTSAAWSAHWHSLKQAGSLTFESLHKRKDGEVLPVEIRVHYMAWEGAEYACGLARDITERVRLQTALREQAVRDPLTGLFNRRYLDETLPREISRCQRTGEPLVAAMLDLDHFKRLNDVYGHEAGDNVLRAIGELLRRTLRNSDLACRYGGEELTIILPGASLEDARARVESLRQMVMRTPVRYRDGELPRVTVSAGLAAAMQPQTDAASLLSRADAALYLAKAQGRNRVVVAADSPIASPDSPARAP